MKAGYHHSKVTSVDAGCKKNPLIMIKERHFTSRMKSEEEEDNITSCVTENSLICIIVSHEKSSAQTLILMNIDMNV